MQIGDALDTDDVNGTSLFLIEIMLATLVISLIVTMLRGDCSHGLAVVLTTVSGDVEVKPCDQQWWDELDFFAVVSSSIKRRSSNTV